MANRHMHVPNHLSNVATGHDFARVLASDSQDQESVAWLGSILSSWQAGAVMNLAGHAISTAKKSDVGESHFQQDQAREEGKAWTYAHIHACLHWQVEGSTGTDSTISMHRRTRNNLDKPVHSML